MSTEIIQLPHIPRAKNEDFSEAFSCPISTEDGATVVAADSRGEAALMIKEEIGDGVDADSLKPGYACYRGGIWRIYDGSIPSDGHAVWIHTPTESEG